MDSEAAAKAAGTRSFSKQSSTSSGKWGVVRDRFSHGARVLGRHTKQFVGLEPTQSQKDHWDAVQCSIVVQKLQETVRESSSKQSLTNYPSQSLVEAILPHESISPGTTKNLLRQLSRQGSNYSSIPSPPSSPSTPMRPSLPTLDEEGRENVEMATLHSEVSTTRERASEPSITATLPSQRGVEHSYSEPAKQLTRLKSSMSSKSAMRSVQHKQTGRAADWHSDPKPDLWKVALISARMVARKGLVPYTSLQSSAHQKSFKIAKSVTDSVPKQEIDEKAKGEAVDSSIDPDISVQRPVSISPRPAGSPLAPHPPAVYSIFSEDDEEEDQEKDMFFGVEHEDIEQPDGSMKRVFPSYKPEPSPVSLLVLREDKIKETENEDRKKQPPEFPTAVSPSAFSPYPDETVKPARRERREQAYLRDPDGTKQYRPSGQVIGGYTFKLLNFRFKKVPRNTAKKLSELEKKSLHRPYFTYWLMIVHLLILIVSLAVYGFAPYGFDQFTVRALVQQSNLAVAVTERNVTPNVWGGPPQEALVLLGAKYGPCMRRDRRLFEGLESSFMREANQSGCCVRRDSSGCVQVPSAARCPEPFADFVFTDSQFDLNTSLYSDRAVCGTSPRTCTDPSISRDNRWQSSEISGWPICQESQPRVNSSHLTCNLTGRPCCVGIQAHCLITTLEDCNFRGGRFHQDAFLCSQVDCLDAICGLLPFANMNVPDQGYRIWISLFVHAGIIHIFFTSLFHFFILRHVESYLGWLKTSIIYIGSGIGGNLVSAFFVPYNPEVGPAGGIFGIISFFIIYILYQAHRLQSPLLELAKLALVILGLFIAGLFPFIDNFAHFGGFLFGILLSGIFVQYVPPYEAEKEYNKEIFLRKNKGKEYKEPKDWILYTKYVFLIVGIPLVLILYTLFFVLFYVVQDTWDGFRYLNCIPFTSTFCLDFGQTIRSRDIFV